MSNQHMRADSPFYAKSGSRPKGTYFPFRGEMGLWFFKDAEGKPHGPYPHKHIAKRVAGETKTRDEGKRAGFSPSPQTPIRRKGVEG